MKRFLQISIAITLLLFICMSSCNKVINTTKIKPHIDSPYGMENIVNGVDSLGSPTAIPGPIAPDINWTIIAFCPYFKVNGGQKEPGICAAARIFGDGKIFAMGHEGYFGSDLDKEDNKQFAINIVDWLDKSGNKRICVRKTQWSSGIEEGLIQELNKAEYGIHRVEREVELTENDLKDCDVLIYLTRWDPITNKEIDAIISFIKNGGGAFLTGLGWSYWSYVNTDLNEFPMNKIAIRTGLTFEAGILCDPEYNYNNQPEHPVIHHLYPESPYFPSQP